MRDEALSRALTSRIRSVDGVVAVHPPRAIVQAAAEVVAGTLALRAPDVLVDVHRDGSSLRVVTGIAVDDARPAKDTVREVGERIRGLVDEHEGVPADLVDVTVRLVEGVGGAAAERTASEADGSDADGSVADGSVATAG